MCILLLGERMHKRGFASGARAPERDVELVGRPLRKMNLDAPFQKLRNACVRRTRFAARRMVCGTACASTWHMMQNALRPALETAAIASSSTMSLDATTLRPSNVCARKTNSAARTTGIATASKLPTSVATIAANCF